MAQATTPKLISLDGEPVPVSPLLPPEVRAKLRDLRSAREREADGDIGKALRNAFLLSLPIYAVGLCMVLVALKGCP